MKKSIQLIAVLMLFSSIIASCSNSDVDEELQLFQEQELFADDTGGEDDPIILPPTPPPGEQIGN